MKTLATYGEDQHSKTRKINLIQDCWTLNCRRIATHGFREEGAWVNRADYDYSHKTSKKNQVWIFSRKSISDNLVVKRQFISLAKKWKNETEHFSTMLHKANNTNYLKIIGLGPEVVPYILEDLQKSPDHWHIALNAITKENPVLPEDIWDMNRICGAWIQWGKHKQLI